MTTNEIISSWLNDVKNDLADNYVRLGLKASGNWERQLESFQKETNQGFSIGIKGAEYTGAIEYGRRKNRNQAPDAVRKWVGWAGSTYIKEWVQNKGLNLNPFAVAYNIAKEGWKVPNPHNAGGLVSDVVTDERINNLTKQIIGYYVNEIKTDMIDTLKFGNNYEIIK